MRRWPLVILVSVGLALMGCGASTDPQRLLSVGDHAAPTMMQAPYNGQYTLYKVASDVKGKTTRTSTVTSLRLKRGDALGFRQRQSGAVAVAAELEISLAPAGGYEWVMQADKGQVDFVKSVVLIAIVVAVVVGIIVAVGVVSAENDLKKDLSGFQNVSIP
ncbi:MAG TPA: hypothetical protein VGI81_16395 [Tepidisphaeraceae bacterium]|jgi:hypothetical protein